MFRPINPLAWVILACITAATFPVYAEDTVMIEDGKQVSMMYTLTVDGDVVDSNAGGEPLVYVQSGGQILPALEAELAGLKVGDKKSVSLAAVDGYGEITEEAYMEVPLEQIPEEARKVDAQLQSPDYPGPIRIIEVKEEVAVLDFNHPLAGQDLAFEVEIVAIEDAPAELVEEVEIVDAAAPAE